jgi:hypothetical protein
MISLTCTSCKKVLEIDDAFAGGVCRCQYCGTIQTVPSALKKVIRPGSPGVAAKTLYQRTSANTASGGASAKSAGAASVPARAAAPPLEKPPAARLPRRVIAIAIVALVVIIGAAVAVMHFHS